MRRHALLSAAYKHHGFVGWWSCARLIYQTEGRGAFTRGLGTTLSRAFIVNAVLFSGYEATMQALCGHDPANAA